MRSGWPRGTGEITRAFLLLADLVVFSIGPSILDLWSVSEAIEVLQEARAINNGRPEGLLVLSKVNERTTLSRELVEEAPKLGLSVAANMIKFLQAYLEAAKEGTVVSRLGSKGRHAAGEIDALFGELN